MSAHSTNTTSSQEAIILTHPWVPMDTRPYDNENSDLIVRRGDVFTSAQHRYEVLSKLGSGTFGQVYKARSLRSGREVAIKVIKNEQAYTNQAKTEIAQLKLVNRVVDPGDEHHIVRLLDSLTHKNHLCLVFELLSHNLYELLKVNGYKGLSLKIVRVFVRQLLETLILLREHGIAHCDLKPENVLLQNSNEALVKLIDFGSACNESKTMYTYIQSRFYRSPEVLLGHSYTTAIDMWSLGCIAMELFVGIPLFPGASQHDVISLIIQTVGWPPNSLLDKAKDTKNFFRQLEVSPGRRKYELRSLAEHSQIMKVEVKEAEKKYHLDKTLTEIISSYPYAPDAEVVAEDRMRDKFQDFIYGILNPDPHARWTPKQAWTHPFITGQPFTGGFLPLDDSELDVPESIQKTLDRTKASLADLCMNPSPPVHPFSPQELANAHRVAMNVMNQLHQDQLSPQNGFNLANSASRPMQYGYGNTMHLPSSIPSSTFAVPSSRPPASIGRSIPSSMQGRLGTSNPYPANYPASVNPASLLDDTGWLQGTAGFNQGAARQGAGSMSYTGGMSSSLGGHYTNTSSAMFRGGIPTPSYGYSSGHMISPGGASRGGMSYAGSYMPSQSLQQAFTTFKQYGGVPPNMPANSLDQLRQGWHPPHNLDGPPNLQRSSGPLQGHHSSSGSLHQMPTNGSRPQNSRPPISSNRLPGGSQQDLSRAHLDQRSRFEGSPYMDGYLGAEGQSYAERPSCPERGTTRRQSHDNVGLPGHGNGRTSLERTSIDRPAYRIGSSDPRLQDFSRLKSSELDVFPEFEHWDPGLSDEQLLSEEHLRQREREIGMPKF